MIAEATEQVSKLVFITTTIWLKRKCLDIQSGRWVTKVKGQEIQVHNKQLKFHSLTLDDAISFNMKDAETFHIYYNTKEPELPINLDDIDEQYNRSSGNPRR